MSVNERDPQTESDRERHWQSGTETGTKTGTKTDTKRYREREVKNYIYW